MISNHRVRYFFSRQYTFLFLVLLFINFSCKYQLNQFERFKSSSLDISEWVSKTKVEKKAVISRFCGFKNIAADFYWLRFLQYDHLCKEISADYVFSCADLITDLDPFFNVVYRFAAVGLSVGLHRPDLSNKLLRKSLHVWEMNGDDWLIYFYLGYNNYFFFNNKQRAARYIQLASEQPSSFCCFSKSKRLPPPEYLKSWVKSLGKCVRCEK